MEHPVWIISYLWILFILLTVKCYPCESSHINLKSCDRCKPGYFVSSECSRRHNTICAPCPDDHFTTDWNSNVSCFPCSQCGVGLFQLNPCTKTSNVLCKTCSSEKVIRNKSFLQDCLGMENDVAEMQADSPMAAEYSYNETSNNQDGQNNNKSHNGTDDLSQYGNNTEDKIYMEKETVLYGSDLGLTEGSGYVFEEKEEDLDINEFLERNITVNPSEAIQDELIPVFAKPTAAAVRNIPRDTEDKGTNNNDTVDIVEGSGLVLEHVLLGGRSNDSVSSLADTKISSDMSLDIDYSGAGMVLPASKGNSDSSDTTKYTILENSSKQVPPHVVDYWGYGPFSQKQTNKRQRHGKQKGHSENTIVMFPDDKTDIGVSKEEKEKFDLHQSGIEGRRRTAVIVGVAVGAVAFFAAGFITSRYCKKHKVLRMGPKVYKNNQYTQNGNVEGLEFHDLRPGMCIYNEPDDIGSVKVKLIPSDDESMEQSNKMKQSTGNGTSGKDTYVKRIEKLKYMDETDEEPDTASADDRLLGDSVGEEQLTSNGMAKNTPQTVTQSGLTKDADDNQRDPDDNRRATDDNRKDHEESATKTLADGVMSKLNQKMAPIENERTPMLPKPIGEETKIES